MDGHCSYTRESVLTPERTLWKHKVTLSISIYIQTFIEPEKQAAICLNSNRLMYQSIRAVNISRADCQGTFMRGQNSHLPDKKRLQNHGSRGKNHMRKSIKAPPLGEKQECKKLKKNYSQNAQKY